ncbi:ribosomal-protein-alanine N-acetyltransferase [Pseudolysobacter antarcticus]|uniref:[Ribosomal protein bS18]-alanine N-acetyltransferase n=2 Tax=Pseudolysobacter antarcticus TaxID=2511995 RepID=A0A411HMV9_9GAMM|nr:ribosomal protein S18-alanine N-acetyltransferase [Pseudolysobacter antarcticus]QBB71817.1 ribosomal-protein-alanine N-acetyltransferase [Pseudolysobacter antarcticus]
MVAQLTSTHAAANMRPMRAEDVDAVSAIEQKSYDYPWTSAIFRDCLRAAYDCWVLVQSGEIVGYGILAAAAGEAHVLNVCVARDAQGEGHGKHLMRRLIDLARWHHASRIFLEVRPSNTRAIALYFNLGFNEIGNRPNYYPAKQGREDAIVMALELFHDAE